MEPKVHIIAEAGTNHGGDLATALALTEAAAACGADSVKFQIIYPEGLYLPCFLIDGAYQDNQVFRQRALSMLTDEQWGEVARHASRLGLPFSSSVFDRRGLDLLRGLQAPYIKIASCDLNNHGLIKAALDGEATVVLSTGMATLSEIDRTLREVTTGKPGQLVLMHCVSLYPCPPQEMNLSFITTLRQTFGLPVGLSDHTETSLAAGLAVGLGATWIEKHLTLDRRAQGFDHAYAMEPLGFQGFVADVRLAQQACRSMPVKVSEAEAATRQRARRGLYAARDLPEGHQLLEGDLLVVRPESELAPPDLPEVVGKVLTRPLRKYQPLKISMLSARIRGDL